MILRPLRLEDFDAYAAFAADPEASRHTGGPQLRPVAWRGFMMIAGAWSLCGYSMFSVILKETGEWIGRVGPWMPEGWPGPEVGWGIVRRLWKRGYATEAATAAIDWAFSELGWSEVVHAIFPENDASAAVARKLGSRNRGQGRLPPPYESSIVDIWGQTREEWEARERLRLDQR
ncbi:MAG TPA: GNAT family N-acetyltransferase [Gammaproteobacteria bacterium]|nr:GNAT family N-acetyltransferase [Gammaproteobacteria bacterium]